MSTLTCHAYAKINLHLEVTARRPDGYHSVETLMQGISLCDTLTVRATDGPISMTCTDPDLSCGEDNLIIRAARAFRAESGIAGGICVHLIKHIPAQAGMGGGSSDAAALLRSMNALYGHPLSPRSLHEIAASLGADVPFFLRTAPAFANGIGTTLAPAPPLPPCSLLLAMGRCDKMSTAAAYAAIDALPYTPRDASPLREALEKGDLARIGSLLFNRFTAINPTAERGVARLRALGALGALLCGSGAAFFGIFPPDRDLTAIADILNQEGYRTWLASPIV